MYNSVATTAAESGNVDSGDESMDLENEKNQKELDLDERNLRYELARKRWADL
jgi:hypothetical protein